MRLDKYGCLVPQVSEDFCAFCFQLLLATLQHHPEPALPVDREAAMSEVGGIFVTWKVGGSKLRGCVGTIRPVSLGQGLAHYALQSAMRDRRFEPVRLQEVPTLTCRVSVLHSFEPCEDAYDWDIGIHGLHITFTVSGGLLCPCTSTEYSATYLPDVIMENGMSQDVAISKLVRKAGYHGSCDDYLIDSIDATRFQASTKELAYDAFARRSGS